MPRRDNELTRASEPPAQPRDPAAALEQLRLLSDKGLLSAAEAARIAGEIKNGALDAPATFDHERARVILESIKGLGPNNFVNVRVDDLAHVASAALQYAPPPNQKQEPEKPVIDGGFTRAATSPDE